MTPALNAGKYIEQAIKCVMAQRYQNLEHIVVDGGSTDGTIPILRKYEHLRSFRWVSGSDGGLYDAINKGLRMSMGEIQSFLSADDLYPPWTLESVVRTFERDRTVDIVYGDGMITQLGGTYAMVHFNPSSQGLRRFLRINGPNTNPFFWKKEVFEELGGYDLGYKLASDYDFLVRACVRFKFSKLNEVLTLWRFRPDSITVDRQRLVQENIRISSKAAGVYPRKRVPLVYFKMIGNYVMNSYPDFIRLTTLCLSDNAHGGWSNLIRSKTISKPRMLRDLLTPLLPQLLISRRMRSKFLPGYIKTSKLEQLATA